MITRRSGKAASGKLIWNQHKTCTLCVEGYCKSVIFKSPTWLTVSWEKQNKTKNNNNNKRTNKQKTKQKQKQKQNQKQFLILFVCLFVFVFVFVFVLFCFVLMLIGWSNIACTLTCYQQCYTLVRTVTRVNESSNLTVFICHSWFTHNHVHATHLHFWVYPSHELELRNN